MTTLTTSSGLWLQRPTTNPIGAANSDSTPPLTHLVAEHKLPTAANSDGPARTRRRTHATVVQRPSARARPPPSPRRMRTRSAIPDDHRAASLLAEDFDPNRPDFP